MSGELEEKEEEEEMDIVLFCFFKGLQMGREGGKRNRTADSAERQEMRQKAE